MGWKSIFFKSQGSNFNAGFTPNYIYKVGSLIAWPPEGFGQHLTIHWIQFFKRVLVNEGGWMLLYMMVSSFGTPEVEVKWPRDVGGDQGSELHLREMLIPWLGAMQSFSHLYLAHCRVLTDRKIGILYDDCGSCNDCAPALRGGSLNVSHVAFSLRSGGETWTLT